MARPRKVQSEQKALVKITQELVLDKITFEQKRQKLQEFYNNWVKPIKEVMTIEMEKCWCDLAKTYNLEV